VLLTVNDQQIPLQFANQNQINFTIPASFPTGMAVLKLNNGSATSLPLEVEIDSAPPVITAITNGLNQVLDGNHFAAVGDTVSAIVSGVDPSVIGSTGRVQVTVSGVPMFVAQVKAGPQPGTVAVVFVISQSFGSSAASVLVSVDGVRTSPYAIIIR
jgi:uncharacterized protein (TIGR03437 family)